MREEFHGDRSTATWKYKLLYGWTPLNTNVWLPSMRELIGTTGTQNTTNGCYKSIMRGLNTSTNTYTDTQGGDQFSYFQQFNASGGGERIWVLGGSEQYWTRSSVYANQQQAWRITNTTTFDWVALTDSAAVHPAAGEIPNRI